jgi:hypothetical protein
MNGRIQEDVGTNYVAWDMHAAARDVRKLFDNLRPAIRHVIV